MHDLPTLPAMLAAPFSSPPADEYEAYLDVLIRLVAWCQERRRPFKHELCQAIRAHLGEAVTTDGPPPAKPRRFCIQRVLDEDSGIVYRTITEAAAAAGCGLGKFNYRIDMGLRINGVRYRRLRADERLGEKGRSRQ